SAITNTGVTSTQSVKDVWDWGVGVGGPIKPDALWFYAAYRWWGSKEYQPGGFYNKSTNPFVYVPDTSRQSYQDLHAQDFGARLTWQATPKQKVNLSYNVQRNCQCFLLLTALTSPEAGPNTEFGPSHHPILSWNYAKSSRLLFEAGVSYLAFISHSRYEQLF